MSVPPGVFLRGGWLGAAGSANAASAKGPHGALRSGVDGGSNAGRTGEQMRPTSYAPRRRLPAIDGARALIIVLLIVQMWLLSATLDAYLAGHTDVVLPAAVISRACFLGAGALYLFV